MRGRILALVIGLLCCLSSPLLAADEIRARADRVSGQIKKDKDQEIVVLEGHVTITHGQTTIETERAVYDKTAGTLRCTGGVRLVHEGIEVEAEELVYLRRTKEGTFRSGVRLSRQEEKNAEGKVTKEPFTLTCRELVFAAEGKQFTARGEAEMVHAEFVATAEEIAYDDARQELRLTGSPRLVHGDETVEAEEIVIAVEKDTFTLYRAKIDFLVKEEENAAATAGAASGPTGGSKPSGS
ncbi:MAG: LptA/OstA family protein [Bacillota bacterium]